MKHIFPLHYLYNTYLRRICMTKESKRDRFVRIAAARTNKILLMLRLLGNCSSKGNYEYTDKDIRKIFSTLEREIKNTKNRFMGIDTKERKFSLK